MSPPPPHRFRPTLLAAALIALGVPLPALQGCDDMEGPCDPDTEGVVCVYAGRARLPGKGLDGVPADQTKLYFPMDVVASPDGALYIVDRSNHRIRMVDPVTTLVTTVVGKGAEGMFTPGPALDTPFRHPAHAAVDAQGRLVIADWWNSLVARWDPATDTVAHLCGDGERGFGGDGGPAIDATLDLPVGVSFAPDGSLWIIDQQSQRIRRVSEGGDGVIETIAGTGEVGDVGDGGPAVDAELHFPVGQTPMGGGRAAFDADGTAYIADSGNHRIRVVRPDGVIDAFAGTGEPGYSGDGGPAADAQFNRPADLDVDVEGRRLFVADTDNHCVRAVGLDDGVIETVVGVCEQGGTEEASGAPATEATLYRPYGVTFHDGWLYVSDTYNHTVLRVRLP